jgi:hypothetical protein
VAVVHDADLYQTIDLAAQVTPLLLAELLHDHTKVEVIVAHHAQEADMQHMHLEERHEIEEEKTTETDVTADESLLQILPSLTA